MGQEPIETTLVAAGPLRTHSDPAAVDVRCLAPRDVREGEVAAQAREPGRGARGAGLARHGAGEGGGAEVVLEAAGRDVLVEVCAHEAMLAPGAACEQGP